MGVPTRAERPGDSQPLPRPNDREDVQSRVIAEIERRRELGIERYGTALQPHNGRSALRDLFEELLDGAMYAMQRLVEEEDLAEPEDLRAAVADAIGDGTASPEDLVAGVLRAIAPRFELLRIYHRQEVEFAEMVGRERDAALERLERLENADARRQRPEAPAGRTWT